jgi:ribosomal protein S6--L-glutamate ligase
MKFAIIGSKSENTQDLITAIQKLGHTASVFLLKDISFDYTHSVFKITTIDENLDTFDIIFFRAFNKNTLLARILAKHLLKKGVTVLDEIIGANDLSGKLFQAQCFSQNNIPHPKTFHSLNKDLFQIWLRKQSFPILAKPIHGQKGEGIHKIDSKETAINFFTTHSKEYLFQEFIPIQSDLRVFIVGDNVIGTIKRYIVDGDFRSNISLGAKSESILAEKSVTQLALHAASVIGYEIAGVDIIQHGNVYMVLEVNDTPQWQGFKKTTGINPADHIVQYALAKHDQKSAEGISQ